MDGGVVLVGGRSSRMGCDKAWLDWHGAPLLAHVCAVVRRAVGGPVVVVRAPGQRLPELPPWVTLTEDSLPGVGPMQGLLDGLQAMEGHCERVFLACVDAPLLAPGFVRGVLDQVDRAAGVDVAIPFVRGFRHPLLAGYRAEVMPALRAALVRGERRAGQIFADRLWLVDEVTLTGHPAIALDDPDLLSVEDVDTPAQLAAATARQCPVVVIERDGERRERRAIRLGDVAAEENVGLERLEIVGDPASAGERLAPLRPGDVVRVS